MQNTALHLFRHVILLLSDVYHRPRLCPSQGHLAFTMHKRSITNPQHIFCAVKRRYLPSIHTRLEQSDNVNGKNKQSNCRR